MGWFSKKEESKKEETNDSSSDSEGEEQSKPQVSASVDIELTKIKSQLDALNEVRKANSEQFTRVSEQIGELRGAIMDSNKSIGTIEVAATKAIDLVNSVQPDKLMIEVRRTDSKVDALHANIEANELMMKDIMQEMKKMREQINFYKGIEQVSKLNDEVKQELIQVKRIEGTLSKHADRVENIFIEVEKKFSDFDKFNQVVKELDRSFKKMSGDFDKMRVTLEEKADKKELIKLVDKFSDFEKHTTNILKLLDQKSKTTITELNNSFEQLKTQLEHKNNIKLDVKPLTDSSVTDVQNSQSSVADKSSSSSTENPAPPSDSTQEKKAESKPKINIFGFLKK